MLVGVGNRFCFLVANVEAGAPSYIYDDTGRLIAVIDPAGDAAIYQYDAVGNLLGITRQPASTVTILNFTPKSGPVGTTVVIAGTGYSTTPSQNTVTFNGTAATVSSATATQLVVTVPSGATTGPIAVTTPTGSATSSGPFTVTTGGSLGAPTLTSFTPTIGTVGTAVTITGTNFDPTPGNDRVRFNITQTTVTTASATSLVGAVPSGATSGKVSVGTTQGTAVSSNDFFVPPAPYTASDVVFTGRMAIGQSLTATIGAANKIGLVLFEGTAGQRVSMNLTGVTITSALLSLNTPAGVTWRTLSTGTSGAFLEPFTLPVSGTYTIVIDPNSTATGNVTIALYNVPPDLAGTLTPGVTTAPLVFSAPGQNGRFTFPATAGHRISVWINTSTFLAGTCNGFSVFQPDGNPVMVSAISAMSGALCTNAFADSLVLAQTGQYTLVLDPAGANTGQVTLTVYDFTDLTGPITPGAATVATLTIPGQKADFTFTGTAGQKVSIVVNTSTVANCTTGALRLLGPNGSQIGGPNLCAGSFLDTQTLATAGTYTVELDPASANIGSVTVTLQSITDLTGTITPGATTGPIVIDTPGQTALLTFSAVANQRASVLVTNSTFSGGGVRVLKPDGSIAGSGGLTTNAFADAFTLPVTGTYTLQIDPFGSATGQVTSLILYVFDDVTGSLTVGGSAVAVTIATPGQRGLLTFAGTASQQVTVRLTGNTIGSTSVSLLKPDGTLQISTVSSAASFNLPQQTLATTGTYTVQVDPVGTRTGSINVQVTSP